MKNYFVNLNKKYLQAFKISVLDRFKKEYIKTDESFLLIIFKELNELFRHLGGRTSSKFNIPKIGEYPDSASYNKLINSISDDIEKIYAGQKIIVDDLNSLIQFNAKQRNQTFEDLMLAQQKVSEVYIKNKKDITGEFVIENSFNSTDQTGSDSFGIEIDETRGVLTLQSDLSENKPVDTENVSVYFVGKQPFLPLYPNNKVMYVGSHWNIPGASSAHFINALDNNASKRYKRMMIDTPDVNTGIGWTEFEAVMTDLIYSFKTKELEYRFSAGGGLAATAESMVIKTQSRDIQALKKEIGMLSNLNKDPSLIYCDISNSLQGANGYVRQNPNLTITSDQDEQYKLTIPLNSTNYTSEIAVSFAAIQGDIPKVIWNKSKVFSSVGGRDVSFNIVEPAKPDEPSNDGYYVCKFTDYVIPSRLELLLTYGGDAWHQIPFKMTHYVYSANNNFELMQNNGVKISLSLGRTYNIFVDSEPDKSKEKYRALNVLRGLTK